jgi:GNAT superfamily N-acetyltransferase
MATSSSRTSPLQIRRATAADVVACGKICFDAFTQINERHRFPPELPTLEIACGVLGMMFSHPHFHCIVAERHGRIVGSNCLDERAVIAGLGPITVAPGEQDGRIGRALMLALLERARERRFAGIRLVQSTFHNRSLALYAKLGFDAREPMSVMQGRPIGRVPEGTDVRDAVEDDVQSCARLCMEAHGYERSSELRDGISQGSARVVERGGRVTGYTTALAYGGHSVGESNEDLQALIGAAEAFEGPGFIVPTRNASLFRWCLVNGLRVVQPMTLMSIGLYNDPASAYLPSVLG